MVGIIIGKIVVTFTVQTPRHRVLVATSDSFIRRMTLFIRTPFGYTTDYWPVGISCCNPDRRWILLHRATWCAVERTVSSHVAYKMQEWCRRDYACTYRPTATSVALGLQPNIRILNKSSNVVCASRILFFAFCLLCLFVALLYYIICIRRRNNNKNNNYRL